MLIYYCWNVDTTELTIEVFSERRATQLTDCGSNGLQSSSVHMQVLLLRRWHRTVIAVIIISLFAVSLTSFIIVSVPDILATSAVRCLSTPCAFVSMTTVPDDEQRYVSSMCFDSRRLGNLMFNYASLLGIARTNRMVPVMPRYNNWTLPGAFDLRVWLHYLSLVHCRGARAGGFHSHCLWPFHTGSTSNVVEV